MKCVLYFFLVLISPVFAFSQTPITTKKKTYVDSVGRYYQQASLPVYLYISTSPDGQGTSLQPITKKEVYLEGHGVHALKHENLVTKTFDEYMIYADGTVPITNATFSGAPAYLSTQQFYGKGLNITLRAKDEMSGIESTYHAINQQEFNRYSALKMDNEGTYTYSYYSSDNTGNAEKVNIKNFIVDLSSPVSYHNIIGISSENIISTNSSIYLTISDSLSGVDKTFYKFDKEAFKPYAGGNIAFQYLADGEHTLTYYSVDHVANKETEKAVKFYLDKTAPIMSADVLGDKFMIGDRIYFSGRTRLKLTAVDNKSGIKEIMYSINSEPYGSYADPFYLPNRAGLHSVKFYAIDNTSNQVKDNIEHSVGVIYVDLTGPSIAHNFLGTTFLKADTVYISPRTKLSLAAHDPESGLQKITYRLDKSDTEVTYSKPIEIAQAGYHTMEYYGYDNVNNKNTKSTLLITDITGPEITYQQAVAASKDGKYPSYTTVFLSATDSEVGLDQIKYSINGGKEQFYAAPIKGFVKNKEYTIKVTATDLLGNSSSSEIKFKTDRY